MLMQVVRALEVVTRAAKGYAALPSLAHRPGHSSQRRKIGWNKRLRNPILAKEDMSRLATWPLSTRQPGECVVRGHNYLEERDYELWTKG
jgi:hypothetical protein